MKKADDIEQGSLQIFGLPTQYVIILWNLLSLSFAEGKNINHVQLGRRCPCVGQVQ